VATTMKLIARQTLGSNAANVTFSDIPGTYTDLLLVCSTRSARTGGPAADNINLEFNGNGSGYSVRALEGNSASASSYSAASQSVLLSGYSSSDTTTASTFASTAIYIPNYAGSTNKSVSSDSATETNGGAANNAFIIAFAGLWANTAAITSIKVISQVANFMTNSSFTLYGITKA
jgi:hypothetical protein